LIPEEKGRGNFDIMMKIVIASRNKKKIEEIKKIFSKTGIECEIYTLNDFPHVDKIEEDGQTFKENAVKKALYVSKATGMIAIADDSGLEVNALGGAPGIRSARYSGPQADDRSNNEKLLRELKGVPEEQRGARFVCCIALTNGDNVQTFEGYVKGKIGHTPKGDKGFGYDPLFYPEGHDRTFAEMTEEEKNTISHRAKALELLGEYLKKNKEKFREG